LEELVHAHAVDWTKRAVRVRFGAPQHHHEVWGRSHLAAAARVEASSSTVVRFLGVNRSSQARQWRKRAKSARRTARALAPLASQGSSTGQERTPNAAGSGRLHRVINWPRDCVWVICRRPDEEPPTGPGCDDRMAMAEVLDLDVGTRIGLSPCRSYAV
jgi:hypothetical protein